MLAEADSPVEKRTSAVKAVLESLTSIANFALLVMQNARNF
jgi:hypothetical protein